MGGPGKYYSKQNKEEERQILYDFTHIWKLKKTSSKEMKKNHKYREQTGSYQRDRGLEGQQNG